MMIRIPRMVKSLVLGFFPHLHRDIAQMPADFLVGPDLAIKGIYYGRDIADHIPLKIRERFANKPYNDRVVGKKIAQTS